MLVDVAASHSITFNWNLTFLGFISDIADLLLIVRTPPGYSHPNIVPQNGKASCFSTGLPDVYSNPASIRAPADTRLLFEPWPLFEPGFYSDIYGSLFV